ncbi:MAG: hypothetical protein VXV96_11330 [Bdellovibrionota bacterium]|nr:hypothetical protein [Bdellovibrionota bacterium]
MRSFLIVLALSFTISIHADQEAKKYNLKEKLEVYDLSLKVHPSLNQYKNLEHFKDRLNALNDGEKKKALEFLHQFDDYFPEKILKAIIHHRFFEYDQSQLEDILTFSMISKVMVIRDFVLDHPAHEDSLKKVTEHKLVTPYNLEGIMLPLYREKAHALSKMTDHELFRDALRNTPLITNSLKSIIGKELPLQFDIFGKIPGNQITQVDNFFTAIKEAKATLWIDQSFLSIFLENQELLSWVKNHPNKDFKVYVSSEDVTRPEFIKLKKKWGERLITLQTNRLTKQSRFHRFLDLAKLIIADGHTPYAFVLYGDKKTMKIKGPVAIVTQALYLKEVERYSESKLTLTPPLDHFINDGDPVRIGFNDGLKANSNNRDLIISSILKAKKSVTIDTEFLYDPLIVDTLIKVKIRRPKLEIKAMVDMSQSFEMNGLPNSMFVEELKKHGIDMRTRKNGSPLESVITIDQQFVLWANLTPDSMDGFHREVLYKVESQGLAKVKYDEFQAIWKDPALAYDLDIENFKVTVEGKKLRSPSSQVVNDMAAKLLRNKAQIIR